MIDRLVHPAGVLTLGGQSYKTKARQDLVTAQADNQRVKIRPARRGQFSPAVDSPSGAASEFTPKHHGPASSPKPSGSASVTPTGARTRQAKIDDGCQRIGDSERRNHRRSTAILLPPEGNIRWAKASKQSLVPSSLRQAIPARLRNSLELAKTGLVRHSEAGTQYVSLALTDTPRDAVMQGSIDSANDTRDNARLESPFGRHNIELIDQEALTLVGQTEVVLMRVR